MTIDQYSWQNDHKLISWNEFPLRHKITQFLIYTERLWISWYWQSIWTKSQNWISSKITQNAAVIPQNEGFYFNSWTPQPFTTRLYNSSDYCKIVISLHLLILTLFNHWKSKSNVIKDYPIWISHTIKWGVLFPQWTSQCLRSWEWVYISIYYTPQITSNAIFIH